MYTKLPIFLPFYQSPDLFNIQKTNLQVSPLIILTLKYINEFLFQTCFENLEGGVDLKYQTEAHWDVTKLDVYTNCEVLQKILDNFRIHTGLWHHTFEHGRETHTWGRSKKCHSGEKLVLPHLRTPNAGLLRQLFVGGTRWQQLRAHLLGGLGR